MRTHCLALLAATVIIACQPPKDMETESMTKLNEFAVVTLTTDLTSLSETQKQMLPLLFEVADIMDSIFWSQAYGNRNELLDTLTDSTLRQLVEINYGPWERLGGNSPFIDSVGVKPPGANFYPVDMTKEEFDTLDDSLKNSYYTLLRRGIQGELKVIPYHQAYAPQVERAAGLMRKAADLSEDDGFKTYLTLRAEALLTDNYQPSDLAWMDMKNNQIDFVVGPIENYEDQLFGIKTAHEAYILIKDTAWSTRLNRYATLLPELQSQLPVEARYKAETPGSNSELAAYDVIYYAGDCNAGSKTIAINLPNDEEVQLAKGSRRLQLKNAMQAKFDKILLPIADQLIAPDQRPHVTFDAFFGNVMFHEVAHGLGIKNTINGNGTVREALKEQYVTLEEGKADILGLFLVEQLIDMKEWNAPVIDHYTTFLAGIFRSIRFGSSSAHGQANLIRLNFFKEYGAFERNEDGQYRVNEKQMQKAISALSEQILIIQGNGDYQAATKMLARYGYISPELEADLKRINSRKIPVDIIFEQGPKALGL